MTQKDKNKVENAAKGSKKENTQIQNVSKKERLASQLRENLLRRKTKEKRNGDFA